MLYNIQQFISRCQGYKRVIKVNSSFRVILLLLHGRYGVVVM